MPRQFDVIIERDEDGYYIAEIGFEPSVLPL